MAIPPQEAGKAGFSLPAIAVSPLIDLLVLEGPPQPFDQDIVITAFSS
jgi:hypothetical protein